MSLYQLRRCVFDYLRAGEVSSGATLDVSRYDLTDEERKSFESKGIAALYQLGFHPVLLNGLCPAIGYERSDYRAILAAQAIQRPGSSDGITSGPDYPTNVRNWMERA
jgi:hypothetical protein